MKKLLALVLMLVLIPGIALAEGTDIAVYLNGEDLRTLWNETPYVIEGDRTYVPIRVISENLGYDVAWNQGAKEVSITRDGTEVVMAVGMADYTVNGELKYMDAQPFLREDRTFVPLRFVAEALGTTVEWDEFYRLVLVGSYIDRPQEERTVEYNMVDMGTKFYFNEADKAALLLVWAADYNNYVFFDKMNYAATGGGMVGNFAVVGQPKDLPMRHIILGKIQGGYLCFCFLGHQNFGFENEEQSLSYQNSVERVKEILKTSHIYMMEELEEYYSQFQ
ncbi:MAG: copper amine oxidase N-terminal domain-containing protein [Tissierellia bacterium]|nr:copper amine oxidase N-terminal domain-containing protein [Tissierellia bacterium]